MKISGKYDLVAIIALTMLLIPIAIYTEGAVRIILGLPFVLFFPGYALIAALFPRNDSISGIERMALSFGLSIAVVPLIGLILNYVWEISLYPILVSNAVFILAMCAVTWFRRRQLPPEQRFEPGIAFKKPEWAGRSRLDRSLSIILALSIVISIGVFIYVVASPKVGEKFTEFYILGTDGTAQDYPKELLLGEEVDLIIGIINHESTNTSYRVGIEIDNEQIEEISPITLANDQKWEGLITFTPTKTGDGQEAEFLLYRDNGSEPYLTTHLWINISAP